MDFVTTPMKTALVVVTCLALLVTSFLVGLSLATKSVAPHPKVSPPVHQTVAPKASVSPKPQDEPTTKISVEVPPPILAQPSRRHDGRHFTHMLAQFMTRYPPAEYRNINQGRAAQLIDGTIVEPGETFSMNAIIGERTKANGFVRGWTIQDGLFIPAYGGGVSQVATTVYNCALLSGMTITAHMAHSLFIDRYPEGRDATLAWPNADMAFRNDTPYPVRVNAWIKPSTPDVYGEMHARIWSTHSAYYNVIMKTGKRFHFVDPADRHLPWNSKAETVDGFPGFSINVWRYLYSPKDQWKPAKIEKIHTVYKPQDTIIVDPKPTPSPSITPGPVPIPVPTEPVSPK